MHEQSLSFLLLSVDPLTEGTFYIPAQFYVKCDGLFLFEAQVQFGSWIPTCALLLFNFPVSPIWRKEEIDN